MNDLTPEELALVEMYRSEKLKAAARAALAGEQANKPVQFEDIKPGMDDKTAAAVWDAIRKGLNS